MLVFTFPETAIGSVAVKHRSHLSGLTTAHVVRCSPGLPRPSIPHMNVSGAIRSEPPVGRLSVVARFEWHEPLLCQAPICPPI
jgi:hypothetical protein